MDIEKEKEKFLNLLRVSYNARLAQGQLLLDDGNFERIIVPHNVLSKYGFDSEEFWLMICPALKEEGYLKSYNDPGLSSIFEEFLEKDSSYKSLKNKRSELYSLLPQSYTFGKAVLSKTTDEFLASVVLTGSEKQRIRNIENRIIEIDDELNKIIKYRKDNFRHEFVINADKIAHANTMYNKDNKMQTNYFYNNSLVHNGVGDNVSKSNEKDKSWYEKPLGVIILGVIIGVIILWIGFLLNWN